ncbi:MAG: hypothetical protein ACXWQ5_16265 [Ktedonobacterales bacterium]
MRARIAQRLLLGAISAAAVVAVGMANVRPALAGPLSGAIFTTVKDGSEVNYNQYADKSLVYLTGGPGAQAPVGAASLPDGVYVFQATDPSGKNLLSQDAAQCRQFTVTGGVISDVAPSVAAGCAHEFNDNSGGSGNNTVQLIPYKDTPNNGGVYKAWATPVANYQCNLTVVDCGYTAGSNVHGFVPSDSKTDNFKVKAEPVREIDTRFHDSAGNLIDGLSVTWTDTLGASNKKWSYENLALDVHHEAHVEAPENGTHYITVNDQAGCTVSGPIQVTNTYLGASYYTSASGAQTVAVDVQQRFKSGTIFLDVWCA